MPLLTADGYRLVVGADGPGEIEVEFRSTSSSGSVQVHAECEGGVPRFEVEQGDNGDGGTDASTEGADDR